MVFQSFALMPHLNAVENAAFGLMLPGTERRSWIGRAIFGSMLSRTERRNRIKKAMEALDTVGLAQYAWHYPDQLSGGQQQRVGLARALASEPEILLMDEPFSALDPLIRTEMQDELLRLQENSTRSIVFVSHDLNEAMRIGDRIAIMHNGSLGADRGTRRDRHQSCQRPCEILLPRGADGSGIESRRYRAAP